MTFLRYPLLIEYFRLKIEYLMRELMSNPKVKAGTTEFTKYLDEEKFKSLIISEP